MSWHLDCGMISEDVFKVIAVFFYFSSTALHEISFSSGV